MRAVEIRPIGAPLLAFVFLLALIGFGYSSSAWNVAHADPLVANIPVGKSPFQIAANPNTNLVYVVNRDSNSTSVINGTSNTVSATIDIPAAHQGLGVDSSTNMVYISAGRGDVYAINGSTNSIVATIKTNDSALENIAVNPVTNTIYVEGAINDSVGELGLVVINGATDTVASAIGGLFGYSIGDIAVNPTTNTVYVSGEDYSPGQTYHVAVINGSTNSLTTYLNFEAGGMAVNPSSNKVYIDAITSIYVLDGATNAVTATIPAPVNDTFGQLAFNPSNSKLYATSSQGNVYTINATADTIIQTTSIGTALSPSYLSVDSSTGQVYVVDQHGTEVSVIDGAPSSSSITTTESQTTMTTSSTSGTSSGIASSTITNSTVTTGPTSTSSSTSTYAAPQFSPLAAVIIFGTVMGFVAVTFREKRGQRRTRPVVENDLQRVFRRST